MFYLDRLTRRNLPRELRKAGIPERYEWWWENHGKHGGGDIAVPWSVVYKLQAIGGRIRRWRY